MTGSAAKAAVLLAVATALASCGALSEDTALNIFVAPGKFDIFSCTDIETRAAGARYRLKELDALMAKSAQGPGGEFVNVIAYRNEHLQTRGDIRLLAEAAAHKGCAGQSVWSSGRSVF